MEQVGQRIRGHREALGLSLRALASRLEVDPAHLSRVENGATPPSDTLLRRLARALEIREEEAFLMAGRIPDTYRALAGDNPAVTAATLDGLAGMLAAAPSAAYRAPSLALAGARSIEDGFPFEEISNVAEVESWRKEVYRPVYHQHKWWAQRLGSVFRAAILGACVPKGTALMELFYEPIKLPAPVIFDPFMGSGTTVGEAHKLGCTAVGRDINPVAYRNVRVALSKVDRSRLLAAFGKVEGSVQRDLGALYETVDSDGNAATVLYFFWVKQVPCPSCSESVDLFSSRIFARHAYAKKNPEAQASCPGCGGVVACRYDATSATCGDCGTSFDPQEGPANRAKATCPACSHEFRIAKTVRETGTPPPHRMYAKLVLRDDGSKEYLPTTDADIASFNRAKDRWLSSSATGPVGRIADGFNTRQVLNYCYTEWRQMFNERQLLGLTTLASAIRDLEDTPEKEALALLFSGVLEFNNMFASYKGEGTGAVRHMFSHHVLKPERTPLEANIWGTPKSSGSFSTLFRSRLLRALDYKEAPFEIVPRIVKGGRLKGDKKFGLSLPMGADVLTECPSTGLPPGSVYLSCGDSARTDLPDRCVDAVVTDPPFFDNVHYSELADFFFSWQQHLFPDPAAAHLESTRQSAEVQDTDADAFSRKLRNVFAECHRVLKDDGLLVFSYHHSRDDGWDSVADAVAGAGFSFVRAQPVKAEMSVAMPKSQAKSPIDIDVMLVCRKRRADARALLPVDTAVAIAVDAAAAQVTRFGASGRRLSYNDTKVVLLSHLLVAVSPGRSGDEVGDAFREGIEAASAALQGIFDSQEVAPRRPPERTATSHPELRFG